MASGGHYAGIDRSQIASKIFKSPRANGIARQIYSVSRESSVINLTPRVSAGKSIFLLSLFVFPSVSGSREVTKRAAYTVGSRCCRIVATRSQTRACMNLGGRLARALSPISRSAIIRVNPRVARKSPRLNHRAISQLVVLGCSRRSIINYRDHSNDQQGRGGLSSLIQFSAKRRGSADAQGCDCGVSEPREHSLERFPLAYYRRDRRDLALHANIVFDPGSMCSDFL